MTLYMRGRERMGISKRRLSVKREEAARFIVVGTCTFFISLAVYYVMAVSECGHNTSYISAYISSTLFNFFASTLFTFKSRPTIGRAITFTISHLVCLSIHITVLNVLITLCGFSDRYAPLVVMIALLPVNFTLIRFALVHDFQRTMHNIATYFKKGR